MKQSEVLFRAIGEVGDDLIARAEQPLKKKPRLVYLRFAALAACCALVLGIAAFARLSFSGQKSESADTASYEATNQNADEESRIAADNAPVESYSAAPSDPESAPEEELKSEPEETGSTATTANAPSVRTILFSGSRFCAVSPGGLDLRPGEQLGLAEDGSDSDLVGFAVYECLGEEPEQLILLLVDGEYLPFRSADE